MIKRLKFFKKNWKLGVHLLFRTKRFGVNNKRWSEFDSIFGWSNKRKFISVLKIRPIINNYKEMKFRAGACHFMNDEDYKITYNEKKNKYNFLPKK